MKDREEVFAEYTRFLRSQTSPFAPVGSTRILKSSIRLLFKKRLGTDDKKIEDEDHIANIVLNPQNRGVFEKLIESSKEKYGQLPEKSDSVEEKNWEVPETISIFGNYEIKNDIKKSILRPYSIKKNKNGQLLWSKPEEKFILELEKTDNGVLWWFKNGVRESKYFGIPYEKEDNHLYGFYPDFIIKISKAILVIEIKDDKDFKNENILKLIAGKNYCEEHNKKEREGKEKVHFWMISPNDYFNFFKSLKEQNLDSFQSSYEKNLSRNEPIRKILDEKKGKPSKEDQKLLEEYDKALTKALNEIKESSNEVENKNTEISLLKMELEDSKSNLEAVLQQKDVSAQVSQQRLKIPKPFNICVLGEVADKNIILQELNDYFLKHGVETTEWGIDFFNNVKLRNSNVLGKLKKAQSKYNLIITAQIHHHSGKGNTSANLLTELKNKKYVNHIVGCSPKSKLTVENILNKLNEYLID